MTQKQIQNIALLERFTPNITSVADCHFPTIRPTGKKGSYKGKPVSAEDGFYLATSSGYDIKEKDVLDWSRYKMLIAAHNNMTLTISMWKEDLDKGMLTIEELEEDGFGDIVLTLKREITKKPKWWIKNSNKTIFCQDEPIFDEDGRIIGYSLGGISTIAAQNRL